MNYRGAVSSTEGRKFTFFLADLNIYPSKGTVVTRYTYKTKVPYVSTFSPDFFFIFLIGIVGGGVQLGPLDTAVSNGLLCQPRVIMMEKSVELLSVETGVLGENLL
jgi:hypothetical protein